MVANNNHQPKMCCNAVWSIRSIGSSTSSLIHLSAPLLLSSTSWSPSSATNSLLLHKRNLYDLMWLPTSSYYLSLWIFESCCHSNSDTSIWQYSLLTFRSFFFFCLVSILWIWVTNFLCCLGTNDSTTSQLIMWAQ